MFTMNLAIVVFCFCFYSVIESQPAGRGLIGDVIGGLGNLTEDIGNAAGDAINDVGGIVDDVVDNAGGTINGVVCGSLDIANALLQQDGPCADNTQSDGNTNDNGDAQSDGNTNDNGDAQSDGNTNDNGDAQSDGSTNDNSEDATLSDVTEA